MLPIRNNVPFPFLISENNIWIALLVSRHRGPFIRRYKNETILYFEHVLHVRNIYNTSFWCCDRKVQMLGKKKQHNNCHLFLRQKSTKCSSKCEPGFTCNCRACPGWYRQCIGSLKQAGLIPVLFCFFLSKQGWYLKCFASITSFTNVVNLHLQFTCVAVSVETKTDQEFVLSNRTPWPAHLPDGYRIIQLSCLLKRTLYRLHNGTAFLSCWDCSSNQLIKLANIFSSYACTGSSKKINAHLLSLVMW